MKTLPIILAALAAFAPTASHAVVDLGGASDISDFYELEYNNEELFPEDFNPTLDPDGDGISTLLEYRCFWSDPFDANDCGPKLQLVPFGGGSWQASWQTRQGLRYQLEFSPDLATWLPAGAPVDGTGGVVIRGLDSGTARLFYRLSCPDASLIDADGDGVCAVEEGILGTSDLTAVSDPVSGADDYCKAAMLVLAAVVPAPGSGAQTIEVGTPVTGLAHDPITEIPQADALVKNGYFNPPGISDPENWERFPGAGEWKPLSGDCLELQKSEDPQPWYGQWCELDAHWQNADRDDHTGPIAHGIEQTILSVPARRQLFLYFDCCRRYAGADTVKVTAHTGDATKEVTLLTHTAPGGWERVMVPLKLTPPSTLMNFQPLCLRFDIGDGLDSYGMFVDNIELIAMDIVPDNGMAGVVGDVVGSSTRGSPVRHFVTPKKSSGLAQDHVKLKAVGLPPARFAECFEWEGGEAGEAAEKCKVSRAATGMTEVRIKSKQGTITAAQMDVWTVWAELVCEKLAGPIIRNANVWTPTPPGLVGPGAAVEATWRFTATVAPETIFTATERPLLDIPPKTLAPNARVRHATDGIEFGQPDHKWDISRQWRCRALSPKIGPMDMMVKPPPGGGTLFDNLPGANVIQPTTPAPGADSYPANPLEGNDDSGYEYEDTDPYPGDGGVSRMTDKDTPRNPIVIHESPAAGDGIEVRMHFREFCRLEIGRKWFLISDHKPWRLHAKLRKTWVAAEDDANSDGKQNGTEGKMRDDGSVSDETNNGW